jgi:uncharacterized cupredoxin-like copper-binding protein
MSHTRTSLAALLALGATTVAAGCGSSSSPSNDVAQVSRQPALRTAARRAPAHRGGESIAVALSEWAIRPSTRTVQAGPVNFGVTNQGKVPHEMVVVRTAKPAAALGRGVRVSEAGSVGEAGDVAPGATKSVTLDLKPGHYVLICNLPGHYMQGMHADLTVR